MKHKSDVRFSEIIKELSEMHDKKEADYGSDEDPLSNVRAGKEFGISPWIGAMLRANDKMKRLQAFARKGSLENESAEDAFRDLAVYAIIGLILYEEE